MSEKNGKTVFRIFFAWNDEMEERWLERMSRLGWHLTCPGFFYRFEKGTPAETVYRLDFQTAGRGDLKEYLALFKDAGWTHVGRFGSWHYFRTTAGCGPVPEIHTDPESKMAKYRRLLGLLVILSAVVWSQILINNGRYGNSGAFWNLIRGIQFFAAVLLSYAIIRLILKIGRIKKNRFPKS
jgi:hypothetical protein